MVITVTADFEPVDPALEDKVHGSWAIMLEMVTADRIVLTWFPFVYREPGWPDRLPSRDPALW